MHYAGSCHCGRIAFDLQTDAPITEAYDCNCSLCRRRGACCGSGRARNCVCRVSRRRWEPTASINIISTIIIARTAALPRSARA